MSNGLVLLGYPYTPSPDTGRGIDHYLYYLAEGYRRRGVPFDVMENGSFSDHGSQLVWGEPEILYRVARRSTGFWHAVSPVGGRVAAVLGRSPLVTTVHDVMPFYMLHRHPARYRFLRFCIRMACRRSDRIIVTFPSVGKYLVDELGLPPEKLSLVPVGINPRLVGVGPGEEPPSSGPPATDTILFFGSWNPIDRGGDIAIRAMVQVLRERPNAQLLLSSQGPETETLRALARQLGVENAVKFIGFVPEEKLAGVFRSGSVMVSPSRLGYGIMTMHAMYAGVPVVVTDVRDQGYFIGTDGIVCPAGDDVAVGVQLARVLGDDALRSQLAVRGHAKVRQFSSERMVEETLRVYRSAGWNGTG